MSRRGNNTSAMDSSRSKLGNKASLLIDPIRSKSAASSSANSPTKRHALKLLEREEQNAMKSRLESLLSHQFIGKYGSKTTQSALNSFITAKIHQFVSSFDNVTQVEEQLPTLEKEIAQRTSELKQEIRQAKESSRHASRQTSDLSSHSNHPNHNPSQTMGLKTLRELTQSDNPKVNSQWPIINALLKIDEEEAKQKELRDKALQQQKFKHNLDEQLHFQEELKRRQLQEKEEQRRRVEAEAQAAELEKLLQRKKQEEHFQQERTMRMQQIEENKAQREKERQMKILAEKMEMEKSKRLAQEEEMKKTLWRQKQKQAQDQLFLENEKNKELKQQQLLERQAYEKKLNEDYERKLAEEERARQNAFQQRVKNQEKFQSSYSTGVGAQLQQKSELEAQRTHEALLKKEQEDLERERIKQETRRQTELRNADYNLRVMEEKRLQKEKERLAAIEQRQRLEREMLEAKLAEKAEKERKKLQYLELKKNLDSQVQFQQQNKMKEKAYYNDSDSLLNPKMLEKLEADPALLNKVIERVNQQKLLSQRGSSQIF